MTSILARPPRWIRGHWPLGAAWIETDAVASAAGRDASHAATVREETVVLGCATDAFLAKRRYPSGRIPKTKAGRDEVVLSKSKSKSKSKPKREKGGCRGRGWSISSLSSVPANSFGLVVHFSQSAILLFRSIDRLSHPLLFVDASFLVFCPLPDLLQETEDLRQKTPRIYDLCVMRYAQLFHFVVSFVRTDRTSYDMGSLWTGRLR